MEKYTPPKSAPLPADFDEFYASLSPQERELHRLAIDKLQSSYFVQWTHFYKKWKTARACETTATTATINTATTKKT